MIRVRIFLVQPRRLIRNLPHTIKERLGKSKSWKAISERGLPTFCVYGCLDGCLFITAAVGISFAQDKILCWLRDSQFFKDNFSKSLDEAVREKSESVSKWRLCTYFGITPPDVISFALTILLLRSPWISTPYRGSLLLAAYKTTGHRYFTSVFSGNRIYATPIFLLIPVAYLITVLRLKSPPPSVQQSARLTAY